MFIIYSKSGKIERLLKELEGIRFDPVATQEELASAIVEKGEIHGALIQLDELGQLWREFLVSLKKSFPLLDVCLLLPEKEAVELKGVVVFPYEGGPLPEALVEHLHALHIENKRKHQRFDWPLKGTLTVPGGLNQEFSMRAISSSGAFLESAEVFPSPGAHGTVKITFHDFSLLSGCRVVGSREATDRSPSGFGLEFTDLTETSRRIIEAMVQDELLRSLLNPDKPPRPPSFFAA